MILLKYMSPHRTLWDVHSVIFFKHACLTHQYQGCSLGDFTHILGKRTAFTAAGRLTGITAIFTGLIISKTKCKVYTRFPLTA